MKWNFRLNPVNHFSRRHGNEGDCTSEKWQGLLCCGYCEFFCNTVLHIFAAKSRSLLYLRVLLKFCGFYKIFIPFQLKLLLNNPGVGNPFHVKLRLFSFIRIIITVTFNIIKKEDNRKSQLAWGSLVYKLESFLKRLLNWFFHLKKLPLTWRCSLSLLV